MGNELLYVVIVAAIGIGWWLGRRERTKSAEVVGPNYYQGLNYLLNEEPDRAVTTFIENLEVTSETLDTHLAMGGLLRRRGELEKAVIVHENILNHAKLNKIEMRGVQLELARDYLLAGLLDRAEALCIQLNGDQEMSNADGIRKQSLKITLEIYETEKEWQQAIEIAKLLATGADTTRYEKAISHYYCELAIEALEEKRLEGARAHLREAIGHDVTNPRTSLLRGELDIREGRYDFAISALRRIKDQDPVYVSESLKFLEQAYQLGNRPQEELRQYLTDCLELTPSISIVLTLARSIRDESGDEAVAKYIANHLKKNPTIRGLTQLIDLHIDNTQGVAKENLALLRSFAEALVADKPAYHCNGCGFDGKRMRWHCPMCKDWATITPIFGLEGE